MVLPGEIGHIGSKCKECGTKLVTTVLNSYAGYYVGTYCPNINYCGMSIGPYSRETEYFSTIDQANEVLLEFNEEGYLNKERGSDIIW